MKTQPYNKSKQKYIGVVKFFDKNKGFGFIASNNCLMKKLMYEQDFYVNNDSFISETAKNDDSIVVFQYKKENGGRDRAINVRNYTQSEGDIILGLNYYGSHEEIRLKGMRINMFNMLGISREKILPLLKEQILANNSRTSKTTIDELKHLISKYKTDLPNGKRYIFTFDFGTEKQLIWQDLFSILTNEEWIEFLNAYPPAMIYAPNGIRTDWIDNIHIDTSDRRLLKDIQYSENFLSQELSEKLKFQREEAIEATVLSIIQENQTKAELPIGLNRRTALEMSIEELYQFTSRRYDDLVDDCKRKVNDNKLALSFETYNKSKSPSNLIALIESYRVLNNSDKYLYDLKRDVQDQIESCFSDEQFSKIIEILNRISDLGKDIVQTTLPRLIQPIKDTLNTHLKIAVENGSELVFKNDFENLFSKLTSLFPKNIKNEIREGYEDEIAKSQSIELIAYASKSTYHWISTQKAIELNTDIIAHWSFDDIIQYIQYKDCKSLDECIKYGIAIKSYEIIKDKDLPFIGLSAEEHTKVCGEYITELNLRFIEKLSQLNFNHELTNLWEAFLSKLKPKSVLHLYYKDIITTLPNGILSDTVKTISIEDSSFPKGKWYSVPKFKDKAYSNIFTNPSIDIFTPIAEYLKEITITHDNIAIISWLVELLSSNRPESDYQEQREWDYAFEKRIKELKSQAPNNKRLAVLLWACHYKTLANKEALTEIFTWLPPFLQIRIVRKLFQLTSSKRMNFTAKSMYEFLTHSGDKLCIPLEILFSYLILREENPKATFSDNDMLRLIIDREDHQEWFSISEFLHSCNGRWLIDDNATPQWANQFYNGILQILEDKTLLTIPRKKIDSSNIPQQYNNKYYSTIQKVIQLQFKQSEYQQETNNQCTTYSFQLKYKFELIFLAREFRLRCDILPDEQAFVIKDNSKECFCECRMASKADNRYGHDVPFFWCNNKPCFRPMVRYRTDYEWDKYTVLDFMRILGIPVDYTNKNGVTTKFGHYTIFQTFLKSFEKFYERLKCRDCGKLLQPIDLSNFAATAVTEFSCFDPECNCYNQPVYLNHCFNKPRCTGIIDSRDSEKCPNGSRICPECGSCCSTEIFMKKITQLKYAGGAISPWLLNIVNNKLGHWEKKKFFCYKCGEGMAREGNKYKCQKCDTTYNAKLSDA